MHIGSKIRISIILLQDISISSGTDVNTADAWWQNTAPWSAVGYSRPYYVSESAEVEPPERESEIPLLLVSQKVTIKTLRAVAITVARATPMTFIPQPTTNNTFSITLTAPDIISAIRGLLLSPRERNIAASAELNSCCTILVSMMCSANWRVVRSACLCCSSIFIPPCLFA